MDTAFEEVIRARKDTPRPGQEGTWITRDMEEGRTAVFTASAMRIRSRFGQGTLVGGLYGVAPGGLFAGESMFSHASDASKTGLVWLVKRPQRWDYGLVDAHSPYDTLGKMGAVEIPRVDYLSRIAPLVAHPPGRDVVLRRGILAVR